MANEIPVKKYDDLPDQIKDDLLRISRALIARDFASLRQIVPFTDWNTQRYIEELEIAAKRDEERFGSAANMFPINVDILRMCEFIGGEDDSDGWHLFVPVYCNAEGGASDLKFVLNARKRGEQYMYSSFAVYTP